MFQKGMFPESHFHARYLVAFLFHSAFVIFKLDKMIWLPPTLVMKHH